MIHHLSIPAQDPGRVAGVFAELFGGVSIPFPPIAGAYLAVAMDAHGTGVEVYPADGVLKPGGPMGADYARTDRPAPFGAVHFALSIGRGIDEIERIARREGWDCHTCDRGGDFHVVELWIENRFMVELLPPAFAAEYLAFTRRFTRGADPVALMASHERPVPA
jgi:hypothetical protein